jgi:hypothetical protein
MANQYVWVVIAVGSFLAGIAIGAAVYAYSAPTQVFGSQMMQQMQEMQGSGGMGMMQ